ncbi:hypothetical protein JXB31_05730 [Candidatus Woesearchaeota archaeon]|nr:hypothetical protein [Candidatus Woesearchaeota archaeon]
MNSKKGYYFILDAIIGLFVITIGIMLIFSYFKVEPSLEQSGFIAFDVMDFLSSNQIKELNSALYGVGGKLHSDGNITNIDNTLLEQIAEFYYRNVTLKSNFTIRLIEDLLNNLSSSVIPYNYGLLLAIDNNTVYNRTGVNAFEMVNATVVVPTKKITYSVYNETQLVGPYIIEVIVWR